MLLTLAIGLGVGLLLGVINVFVRDVGQVVPVALQFGFWLAPIAYTPDVVPAALRRLLYLNPVTPIVQGYQDALLFDQVPDLRRSRSPCAVRTGAARGGTGSVSPGERGDG